MVTFLKDDGHVAGKSEPFADGWNDNGYYLGRPVDVAQLADGSLLVSDDQGPHDADAREHRRAVG
jgi:glucose/arabinose dehydrogenase